MALTTRELVKAHLNVQGTGLDTLIDAVIAAVSDAIAWHCRRVDARTGASLLERRVARVEYPRIVGAKALLACYPIESVAEVLQAADRDWDNADELVEDADWVRDDPRSDALVHLRSGWLAGVRMVRVTYTGGYFTGAAVDLPEGAALLPDGLRQAATIQAVHEVKYRDKLGEQNVQVGPMSISQIRDGLLDRARQYLEPHLRWD